MAIADPDGLGANFLRLVSWCLPELETVSNSHQYERDTKREGPSPHNRATESRVRLQA